MFRAAMFYTPGAVPIAGKSTQLGLLLMILFSVFPGTGNRLRVFILCPITVFLAVSSRGSFT